MEEEIKMLTLVIKNMCLYVDSLYMALNCFEAVCLSDITGKDRCLTVRRSTLSVPVIPIQHEPCIFLLQ